MAGCCEGKSLRKAGEWGAYAASETIQLYGIKPQDNYDEIKNYRPSFRERLKHRTSEATVSWREGVKYTKKPVGYFPAKPVGDISR